jgi:hypothetical protein
MYGDGLKFLGYYKQKTVNAEQQGKQRDKSYLYNWI